MLGASRSTHVRGRRVRNELEHSCSSTFCWFASILRARQRRPTPRAFQLLQLTLARLCRSVATGRLVRLSWAAMHRSDSAIFRFRVAMVFSVWPVDPVISPIVNRTVSKAFTASRFFLS
jgi:hypothetical protein